MYPGYEPKPDDVFHAVGYTTRDISDNTDFHLTAEFLTAWGGRTKTCGDNSVHSYARCSRARSSASSSKCYLLTRFWAITRCPTQGRIRRCFCLLST